MTLNHVNIFHSDTLCISNSTSHYPEEAYSYTVTNQRERKHYVTEITATKLLQLMMVNTHCWKFYNKICDHVNNSQDLRWTQAREKHWSLRYPSFSVNPPRIRAVIHDFPLHEQSKQTFSCLPPPASPGPASFWRFAQLLVQLQQAPETLVFRSILSSGVATSHLWLFKL